MNFEGKCHKILIHYTFFLHREEEQNSMRVISLQSTYSGVWPICTRFLLIESSILICWLKLEIIIFICKSVSI